jgi:hypothetical protein
MSDLVGYLLEGLSKLDQSSPITVADLVKVLERADKELTSDAQDKWYHEG